MAETNKYICDSHGNEVLFRTNRYLNDGHGLTVDVRGYGCPADPDLATQLMADLRMQYERNLGGRNTKGTNGDKQPVSHVHFFASWHTDEVVPPEERHEMVAELIGRTDLKNFPVLVADHNNTDEDHIHLSVGVFSLDGNRKLGMNNSKLYGFQREWDRICVEHGYSIIEKPELFRDKGYKEWFDDVRASGSVTIHPPVQKTRSKKTQKELYADAVGYKRREEKVTKIPAMTAKNRGTHFYCLPHLSDPMAVHRDFDKPLYIYAMDQNGERRPPMHLAFDMQRQWCLRCLERLNSLDMALVTGRSKLEQRLKSAAEVAEESLGLLENLDIATRADLERHKKGVGKELSQCQKYLAEIDRDISQANDEQQKEKLMARKEKTEDKERALKLEYRRIKKTEALFEQLMDPDAWAEFTDSLLKRTMSQKRRQERNIELFEWHYRDIAQLLGVPIDHINKLWEELNQTPDERIMEVWVEVRANVTVQYKKTSKEVYTIYTDLGLYGMEYRAIRGAIHDLSRSMWHLGPLALYFLPLYLVVRAALFVSEKCVQRDMACIKQTIEEIRWHNQNSLKQLEAAKSKCAIMIVYGDVNAAAEAWNEFIEVCHEIRNREFDLRYKEVGIEPPPNAVAAEGIFSGSLVEQISAEKKSLVCDFEKRIARDEEEMAALMAKKNKERFRSTIDRLAELSGQSQKSEFDAKIYDAQQRAGGARGNAHENSFER